MTDTKVRRELPIPAAAKHKMKVHATATGSTLGEDLAEIVRAYADGQYNGADGRINVATVEDPGLSDTDKRVKFWIEEAVWEQARIRSVTDETSVASAVRRAVTALNG